MESETEHPVLYLFAGSNGAGKTTFARAYLTSFEKPPRFLNADEIARGLSPLNPSSVALKAGRLLLHEIDQCLKAKQSFALESTLSGTAQVNILKKAKALGYQIELHYLWIPSPKLAIQRIAQRVKKGGHHIPSEDVLRRFTRGLDNLMRFYGPISDRWAIWQNTAKHPDLILESPPATLSELEQLLQP